MSSILSGPRSREVPHPAFFFFAGSSGGGGSVSDGGGGGNSLGGGGALELGGGGGANVSGGGGGIEESPLLKLAILVNDGIRVCGTFGYSLARPHNITRVKCGRRESVDVRSL